ncbi:hypothetical protein ACJMK2_030940 [Sinanodonta woodiana]|uniref:Calponin-homology (CH) domain-containing protein n=1 Tax=Sinanodonta woodiana TaxID=1069815 RepID=A0ABD3WZ09_SINWO
MAYRPLGYGLTAEVNYKIRGKYSTEMEQAARVWIEDVLGRALVEGADPNTPLGMDVFQAALKDGVILCELMNTLKPGAVKRVNDSKIAFKQMENIANFLKAAEEYGLKQIDQFRTADLYEKQNMTQVVQSIHALGSVAQAHGFDGPVLGPKPAHESKRNFSEETLAAGRTVIGLQMGSHTGANQKGMNIGKTRSIMD